MDRVIIPLHQFEIRYTSMLDFSTFAKKIAGPYIQRTSSFNVENENTMREKITLTFGDDEATSILIWFDRVVFRTTIGIEGLESPNSLAEEAFFGILEKIKQQSTFGNFLNSLFYNLGIVEKDTSRKDVLADLTKEYLNDRNCEILMPGFNDIAVTLVHEDTYNETTLTIGPYVGVEDFSKRNIALTRGNLLELLDKQGTMFDYKILSNGQSSFDFRQYKNLLKEFKKTIEKL